MKTLPTLYKKTSTGAIQYWKIESEETNQGFTFGLGGIRTEYGQVDTDSPQITFDCIKEGKNIGKKNATTPLQQAEAEAFAKWEKQKKKGYVESIKAAEAGELDDLIEGGVEPTLAFSYMDVIYDMRPGHEQDPPKLVKTKDAKKIKFPVYVQPKLDGIRSTSQDEGAEARTMWSRTRKPIYSMPHIQGELTSLFRGSKKPSDGELYNHEFKHDFEKIVSAVRKDEAEEGYLNVQYHMYDIVMEGTFADRIEYLANLVHSYEKSVASLKYITLVETVLVNNDEELMEVFKRFRKLGYEGAMLRNAAGKYVHKRSYDLQKFKEFHEDDFSIVGIEEGRGKLAGCVGSFICLTKEQTQFSVKLEGETEYLQKCFENHRLWQGKKLTVVYQGYTVAERKPRFPVGKVIRDYE